MQVLIVEDEARIAKRIERFTRELLQDQLTHLTLKPKLSEALDYVLNHPIDVLLLDLNLHGKDGFELLKTAVAHSFHTIVISAYRNRAIEAFEYGVIDFVAKPFDIERLKKAFERITDSQQRATYATKYLAIKKQGRIHLLTIEDILYLQGANIYSQVYLQNGQKDLYDKSLEKVLQLLPANFERIHKSYIVNMQQAQEIFVHSGSKYELMLKNGEILPIGRTRYKLIKERFFGE